MGVTQKEQTEGSNDILNYSPTTSRNPNHVPPAFCLLLSYNNLSTNPHSCCARLLGVEVKEEQTEESNDIVKSPPHSQLNPNDEPAFLSYNNLWSNSRPRYAQRSVWELQKKREAMTF